MRRLTPLALLLLVVTAPPLKAQRTPSAPDQPPVIEITPLQSPAATAGTEARYRVRVIDPEGAHVSATLELGPHSMSMRPIVLEPSPAEREIAWFVDELGESTLIVAAHNATTPARSVRSALRIRVDGGAQYWRSSVIDVDGDLKPEILATSRSTPPLPASTGAICVYSDFAPGGLFARHLWSSRHVATEFGFDLEPQIDFDLDGKLDLVAHSGTTTAIGDGLLHVFRGGEFRVKDRADDAILDPRSVTWWWDASGPTVAFDVTGDGHEDVIAAAVFDENGFYFPGALHVFAASAGAGGTLARTATCTLSRNADHYLGAGTGRIFASADLTGDGVADLVAAAPYAKVAGFDDAGAVALFAGGSTMSGTVTPTALLISPTPLAYAHFGGLHYSNSFELADFDGDGQLDLLVASRNDPAGGAIFMFRGGATMVGSPAPMAKLVVPGAGVNDRLGEIPAGNGVALADVTGDGALDVIAATTLADVGGIVDAGAVYVWSGATPWSGTRAPDFTLGDAIAQLDGNLAAGAQGLRLFDATGDGAVDVVTTDPFFDVGGIADAGAIHVWAGGGGWIAPVAPTATLVAANPSAGDELGRQEAEDGGVGFPSVVNVPGFLRRDVDGDGREDWIVGSHYADVGGVADTGCVHLFPTGSALAGTVLPFAQLVVPGASAGDHLGHDTSMSWTPRDPPMRCEEVTGDGIDDVIVRATDADLGGIDAGAVYIWNGGAALSGVRAPDATLTGAGAGAHLGQSMVIGDVDADGVLDFALYAPGVKIGTAVHAGRCYTFSGGAALTGTPAPLASLQRKSPSTWDGNQWTLLIHDFDGNGVNDLTVSAPFATARGVANAGAILWWADSKPASTGGAVELLPPVSKQWDLFGF